MPTVNIRAFSHKKSTVIENGGPKLPTAAQLELGEIAINFAKGYETLSIKNNNNEIVTFTNDNYWINKELAIAAALNDLNDRKQDALEMDEIPTKGSENVVTSGGLYSYITEIEQVTAAALNDLNDRITSLALSDDYTAAAQGTPPLAGDTYETAISKLHKVILDDELITSSALNDLNSRIDNLSLSEDYVAADPASEPVGGDTYEEAISKLHGAILENELATSGALNDLNTRISDIVIPELILSEDYEPSSLSNEDLFLAPGDSYETAFAKLEKTINDNENITSAALTDLDSRLNLLHLPQSLDDIPDGSTRKLSDYAKTTLLATKQDALVSGTNIKTINNESILGSGNITIQGGSGGDTNVIETVKVNGTALTPDANKAVDITSIPASIVTQDSTHRFVSDTEKTTWNNKVSNVQSDWNATSGLAQILNKPTIPNDSNLVHKTGNETISGIKSFQRIKRAHTVDVLNEAWNWITYDDMDGGQHTLQQDLDARNNVQADWNQTTTTAADYIKNKPTIPTAVTESTVSGWGFTKNTGTVTGVKMNGTTNNPTNGVVDLGTVLTSFTETDPTVPAWAKASTKPTYTAQEVGALPNTYTPPVTSVNGQTGAVSLSIPDDSNLVHITGNETITGTKMFKSEAGSEVTINSNIVKNFGEAPNNNWGWINVIGKGGLNETLQQALDARNNLVTSVNGMTGAVTIDVPVTSVDGKTGAVTINHPVTSVNGQTGAVNLTIPSAPGTLNTTATTAQSTSSSEALSGNITLHKVAKTGTYNDLIGKPTIPAAQVQSDWNATSGMGVILNKPTIPTVNNATLTIQKNGTTVGTFTANASSNATANILVNELPTVSSSDNGKILQVVNGAWALVNPTSIYSGTSEPDSNTGNNGDLYLQTS